MHTPYYYRKPNHLYCIVSAEAYGWGTGTIADGKQVFRGPTAFLVFDQDGRLLRGEDSSQYEEDANWLTELAFAEGPIHVRRFWVPEFWVGIEDLPDDLAAFYTAPDDFDGEPSDVESWKKADQYVLHAGCGDYFMNKAGDVEAS